MALSGSIDFNQTANEIINDALIICGAIEEGEAPDAAGTSFALRQLNRMVKSWAVDGVHLWKQDEGVLFLEKGQSLYQIGTGGDDVTLDDDAVKTELAADVAASGTSITVDSITGMSASDNIGVVLDDLTIHWTTINGAPSGSTVTLTVGVASAASTDAHVYVYTKKIDRPLRVLSARRRGEDGNDVPIEVTARSTYFDTPNKTNEGLPVQVYYDPQLTTGEMHIWPTPESPNDRIFFTCTLPIQDFDTTAQNPDFPQEWLDALVWGLARRLAPTYGIPVALRMEIGQGAATLYENIRNFDVEPVPLQFEVGEEF